MRFQRSTRLTPTSQPQSRLPQSVPLPRRLENLPRVSASVKPQPRASQLPQHQSSPTSPPSVRLAFVVRLTSRSLAALASASTIHQSPHATALHRASSRTLRSLPLASRHRSRCWSNRLLDRVLIRSKAKSTHSSKRSLVASSWLSQSRTACAHSSDAWTTSTTQRRLPLVVPTTGQMIRAHGLLVAHTSR